MKLNGPGKYDMQCTAVRETTSAKGVILMVIDGDQGTGFSVQVAPVLLATLPDVLEMVAKQIRSFVMTATN